MPRLALNLLDSPSRTWICNPPASDSSVARTTALSHHAGHNPSAATLPVLFSDRKGREDAHKLHGRLAGMQDHPGLPAEGEGRPRTAGYLGTTVSPAAPGPRQLTEALGGSASQREKAPQSRGQRHDWQLSSLTERGAAKGSSRPQLSSFPARTSATPAASGSRDPKTGSSSTGGGGRGRHHACAQQAQLSGSALLWPLAVVLTFAGAFPPFGQSVN